MSLTNKPQSGGILIAFMQLRIPTSAAERRYINNIYNTETTFQPQSGDILIEHINTPQPKAPEERHI